MCSKDLCSHEIRDSVGSYNQANCKVQLPQVIWLDASNDPEHPSPGPSSGAVVWKCTSEQVSNRLEHMFFMLLECYELPLA